MQICKTVESIRQTLKDSGPPILVPTMGSLHAGHVALIQRAREVAGPSALVIASVFVNRLQFSEGEDFEQYPRTLDQDIEVLGRSGCDVLFAPGEAEMYPEQQLVQVHPTGRLAEELEGRCRPGFFTGVCTVVLKLFNIIRPRAAVFGRKDFQQLRIVQQMVRQLGLQIEVISCPTVRAEDGLALSSRNAYLGPAQRSRATTLYAAVSAAANSVRAEPDRWIEAESRARADLGLVGWAVDYVAVRRSSDLGPPTGTAGEALVVLVAARLGGTRLIDCVDVPYS